VPSSRTTSLDGSDGLYDEGFTADRSRYSCEQAPASAGLERALQDAAAVTDHLRARADIDPARVLVGRVSRGGLLAAVHMAQRPGVYRAALNFVGGWLGEACVDAVAVNRDSFVRAAVAPQPALWLYAENDPFYSVMHSRANHDAFAAAGGRGPFKLYRRADPGRSGHDLLDEPALWQADRESFVLAALP
jgi:dienelactone hydrolase